MDDQVSAEIVARIAALPEFRMGVHRVGVRLDDGRWYDDVLVSGRRVTRVLGRDDVPFQASQIVAVEDQSEGRHSR